MSEEREAYERNPCEDTAREWWCAAQSAVEQEDALQAWKSEEAKGDSDEHNHGRD